MQAPSPGLCAQRHDLARALFGPDVRICVTDPQQPQPAPFPDEAAGLSPRAVEKRQREFAAGRAAAHQAIHDLGHPPVAIPVGEHRAPIWPNGLTGSISHTHSCAMAAVADTKDFAGLGLDVEEDTPLKPELWDAICSAGEQDWMRRQKNPGQMGKLIFSAKEAAYKCQYALSETYFGFDGMELEIDSHDNRFLARFTADRAPFKAADEIAGRFAIGAGVIITAAELPRAVADHMQQRPE
ncbi:4'-phosphopantetheinyl transferase superfamily protein [Epibacterium ulvae]|uniref:4'-phosphopantetheinyl transferase family protein n=1 Tax=Epibacterium ulvae TaxID=1156985 RepID=UPI001BFC5C8A|nr:4'-phosphopantetheinyl transferase superfamily protein [Epibacterium ulvae]MBT8153953.1 4'-phosphopantetheinyl transferase superfamily protein [Epibacterium ulvae]